MYLHLRMSWNPSLQTLQQAFQSALSDWRLTAKHRWKIQYAQLSSLTVRVNGQTNRISRWSLSYTGTTGVSWHCITNCCYIVSAIIVPKCLQKETLLKLHSGHQGIEWCHMRALSSVWWPGLSNDVWQMNQRCPECLKRSTSHCEPMIPSKLPDYRLYPWQKVATDLFELKGVTYLLVVDYFSRFPEVAKLTTTTPASVIAALKYIFSQHGIPEVLP